MRNVNSAVGLAIIILMSLETLVTNEVTILKTLGIVVGSFLVFNPFGTK